MVSFLVAVLHVKLVTVSLPMYVHVSVNELLSVAAGDDGDRTTSPCVLPECKYRNNLLYEQSNMQLQDVI